MSSLGPITEQSTTNKAPLCPICQNNLYFSISPNSHYESLTTTCLKCKNTIKYFKEEVEKI